MDSACLTKGFTGNDELLVWDGQYGTTYTVDLKLKKHQHLRSHFLSSMESEHGHTRMLC